MAPRREVGALADERFTPVFLRNATVYFSVFGDEKKKTDSTTAAAPQFPAILFQSRRGLQPQDGLLRMRPFP